MAHAPINKILQIVAAVPLAGFWILDVPWLLLPKVEEAKSREKIPLPIFWFSQTATAQSIAPEENSTGTILTPLDPGDNPTRFEITGGRRSSDGTNLFHSFTQFNIEQNQTVNFVSSPTIENILTRVNGGDPSLINGLLQVTGGNSNLFIMNPAGIVFGSNARLDVPGSFIATTASSIGFNFGWFDAVGNLDYEALNGAPTSFSFPTETAGAIVNAGELAVAAGENLLLIGGKVINTGKISSPGGQITIAAIPGANLVRVTQEGHLLNLELETIAPDDTETEEIERFNPLSLPELLTTGGSDRVETATGISVEGDRVFLTASQQEIPKETGTAIVSGSIDVSSVESSLPFGGRVNIVGAKVGLFNANINASGAYIAGDVRIGGDYQGEGLTANRIYIDENTAIEANSFFGEGGRVSLWSDEATAFFGKITAQGNTPLNSMRESASLATEPGSNFVAVGSRNSLIFDGTISLFGTDSSLGNLVLSAADFTVVDTEIVRNSNLLSENSAAASQISAAALSNLTGNTNLTVNATNDIKIEDLASDRLVLENTVGEKVTLKADFDRDGNGSFSMNAEETINTAGGAINIDGASVTAGNINTLGGELTISSTVNSITTNNLASASSNTGATGGNITINARGNLRAGEINSSGDLQGGQINLSSETGSLETTAKIDASSTNGRAGSLNLKADLDLDIGDIDARGRSNGGNINLEARNSVTTRGILTSSNTADSGNITLTGNEINLLGREGSISTNGNLILQPYSPERNLNLGSVENAESLNLTTAELATLEDGFNSITIGRENSRGTIAIAPGNSDQEGLIFKDPVILRSPGDNGSIAGGGDITGVGNASIALNANEDIITGNISSPTEIKMNSDRGNITTGNLSLTEGSQGQINLEASRDIITGELTSSRGLNLTSILGNITTGNIDTKVVEGSGGNLNLSSNRGFVETGNLNSAGTAGGGNIEITAGDRITTGSINSSSILGNGGTVRLNAGNDIEAVSINTQGGSVGSGGELRVTTGQYFRVTGTVLSPADNRKQANTTQNGVAPSISTAGGMGGGGIVIQNGGGDCLGGATCSKTPFTVGDPTTNGTAGAITDGEFTILPTQILPNNFKIREFGETLRQNSDSNQSETEAETSEEPSTSETQQPTESGTPGEQTESNPEETQAESPTQQEPTPSAAGTGPNQSESGETGGGESAVSGNGQEAIAPKPETNSNLPESAKPTFQETENPAPSSPVVNNPEPTRNEAPSSPVVNNPAPTPNPASTSEVLENTMVPSILENSGEVARVLNNNVELDSTVLHSSNPESPVLENIQVTSPITDNSNPETSVLEHPNPAGPLLDPSSSIVDNQESSLVTPNQAEPRISDTSEVNPGSHSASKTVPIQESTIAPTHPLPGTNPNNNLINNQINLIDTVSQVEQIRGREFISYLGEDIAYREVTAANIRESLSSVAKIGIRPAVIYVSARDNYLELQLFLPDGRPIVKSSGLKREEVLEVAREFASKVRTPNRLDTKDYLPSAQQLYNWLIQPLSETLAANNINMLIFSMDTGLRTIPLAALHDGKEYLVERYSIALIPSFSLTDTRYVGLKGAHVLAMGASEFPANAEQSPLPAVPTEISTIVGQLWPGESFLNQGFTLDNLKEQRNKEQFRIIHLATHGEFHPGGAENSYIQFWDEKLGMDRLRQLRLHSPQVELLVLSACTTAVGDEDAELGFAGLAVQAGVKSALASLWYVSDTATLGLMSEFYRQLLAGPVKAEALREAQLAMLRGQLHLKDGYLYRGGQRPVLLPDELAGGGNRDLSHPYYWAAFTMIGSPW